MYLNIMSKFKNNYFSSSMTIKKMLSKSPKKKIINRRRHILEQKRKKSTLLKTPKRLSPFNRIESSSTRSTAKPPKNTTTTNSDPAPSPSLSVLAALEKTSGLWFSQPLQRTGRFSNLKRTKIVIFLRL